MYNRIIVRSSCNGGARCFILSLNSLAIQLSRHVTSSFARPFIAFCPAFSHCLSRCAPMCNFISSTRSPRVLCVSSSFFFSFPFPSVTPLRPIISSPTFLRPLPIENTRLIRENLKILSYEGFHVRGI